MSRQLFVAVLSRYIPKESIPYCTRIWEEKPFDITVTKKRNSKLGDYSYDPRERRHKITVNGDLNPYSFLVTYVHEVAHFRTYVEYGFDVKPHGTEWKNVFSKLMWPLLMNNIFPENMMPALKNYFSNPKASSCSDIDLLKALRMEGEDAGQIFLSEVPIGKSFNFNGKVYIREEKRRTRSLCQEVKTGRKFYISEGAMVDMVE
jgi:SprT protein